MNHVPQTIEWAGVLVIAIVGWFLLIPFFILFRNRVAFWL